MDRNELLEIFTRQQRIEVTYPDIAREVDGSVVRHISLAGEDGFVIFSALSEETAESVISAQIARFQSIPQDFEWKVYDYDLPPDLIGRLRRRGFEIDEPEALLVLELSAGVEALSRPVPATLVPVHDPAEIDTVIALENEVWGTDHSELGERLKKDLQEYPELLSVYISYQAQQPASAAWTYFHPGTRFASLWGGATLPQFRRQGHYSRLLAARAQEAVQKGFSLLTVDASPQSRPILEKHGFQFLAFSTPCRWSART